MFLRLLQFEEVQKGEVEENTYINLDEDRRKVTSLENKCNGNFSVVIMQ